MFYAALQASVLSNIEVIMGWECKTPPYILDISPDNSGAGITYIQTINPILNDEVASDEDVF